MQGAVNMDATLTMEMNKSKTEESPWQMAVETELDNLGGATPLKAPYQVHW
ncbi:hypothetical protein K443DRAFT_3105 [Laccaria amethystina LaAM-08-1]|uniref:Uncharacterized protein n=1 Tax=Laccaria amethystina LaAM-08-1 TaxID=1095629 RepID=A0A0C9Y7X0_9AGAR|nr:hypothetical protein K443DRAFT_3105 [Laccaria amethystina LaAM-08-1]